MRSEEIVFSNQNIALAGSLYKPETIAPYPAVVVVHPASGGERTDPFYDHLKSELPENGIAVLIFDRRGSGASEGEFETADFEALAGDVISAVEHLQSHSEIDRTRIGLHGTSQGAWIAPIAAARKPDIAFLIAVSACGVSPAEQMDYGVSVHLAKHGFDQSAVEQAIELRNLINQYFRGQLTRVEVTAVLRRFEPEPWYEQAYLYPSAELPVDVTQSKWHYEMDYEPLSIWREVKQSTLFLFAAVDEWVPIEQSIVNYKNATAHLTDVAFKQISGTDHLMRDTNGEISKGYLETLIAWLKPRISVHRSL